MFCKTMSCFAATIIAITLSSPSFAFDYSGTYKVKGLDFGGGEYSGTAVITQASGSIYNISWSLKTAGRKIKPYGICIAEETRLSCASRPAKKEPDDTGIIIYAPAGPKLEGQWTQIGYSVFGSETLRKID